MLLSSNYRQTGFCKIVMYIKVGYGAAKERTTTKPLFLSGAAGESQLTLPALAHRD